MAFPKEPLFLSPVFFEKIWGGRKLETHFNKKLPSQNNIGESWELSGFGTFQTLVSTGKFHGTTLGELFSLYGEGLVGKHAADFPIFPLLIKFIDANAALSIQVHPDDKTAQTYYGESFGKTECWYIANAGPKAALGIGFTETIERSKLHDIIIDRSIEQLIHTFPVHTGEVYFIPSGTIHAIMGDVVIYEVQQSSNTTLRMYDWGRVDTSGNPRTVHIDEAVKIVTVSTVDSYRVNKKHLSVTKEGSISLLLSCPYFAIEEYLCIKNGTMSLQNHDSFRILTLMDGSADVFWDSGNRTIHKGSTVLIPAVLEEISIKSHEDTVCLSTFIPDFQKTT